MKTINFILKMLGYALVAFGGILLIGTPGALENGTITFGQTIIQALIAILCIGSAFGLYIIKEALKYYFN